MIADMKVKANLIQVFAPVFFLLVVVIDLGQDSQGELRVWNMKSGSVECCYGSSSQIWTISTYFFQVNDDYRGLLDLWTKEQNTYNKHHIYNGVPFNWYVT